jgi:hypothetical protein
MRLSLLVIHLISLRANRGCDTDPVIGGSEFCIYEVRQGADKRGFDLITEALPFGRLWYCKPDETIGYAKFYSRSHAVVVRVFDESGALVETHESDGVFREP